jgi:glycosyltransferase involved in cell wall biosynthesis
MRVLYLTMNPNRESTTVPTEGWFRTLRPRGLEPVLISSVSGSFQKWAGEEGVPCYETRLPFPNKMRPWAFLSSLVSVIRVARRHRVDLIHSNEQDVYPISQYAARCLRLPLVVSVHFTMDDGYVRWAFSGAKQPARMFFVSRGSQEACRPAVESVIPEARWRVLYNGLDLDRFRPDSELRAAFRREHRLDGLTVIGVACALRPRKQLEHLFAAAAKSPLTNLRVLVAGGPVAGDEEYAKGLLDDGRKLLGDRLVHVGHLRDLRGFYNALDLFVNTSQEEACSISVIEALACGCPIVGYPSKSVDEQVLPSGGEIVPQDAQAELAGALNRWLSEPARLSAARANARARAEQAFDIHALSSQLWSEYESVLGASR